MRIGHVLLLCAANQHAAHASKQHPSAQSSARKRTGEEMNHGLRLQHSIPMRLGSERLHQRTKAIAQRRNHGTLEIDLPVHRHQHLNRLHLRIARRQRSACEGVLVRKILDRVPQNFQRTPGLAIDAASPPRKRRYHLGLLGCCSGPACRRRSHSNAQIFPAFRPSLSPSAATGAMSRFATIYDDLSFPADK